MNPFFSADAISRELANIWSLHKSPAFREYLESIFHRPFPAPVRFDKVYIVEADDGDIEFGSLHDFKRWWEVDDCGMREMASPPSLATLDDAQNVRQGFYTTPIVRFFCEGNRILIGESYGPHLIARTSADITYEASGIALRNRSVVWLA